MTHEGVIFLMRFIFVLFILLVVSSCDRGGIEIIASDYSVIEGSNGETELEVHFDVRGVIKKDIVLPISIIPISTDPSDLRSFNKELLIIKGAKAASLNIIINGDDELEKDEEFFVKVDLSNLPGARLNSDAVSGVIKVTILNDDLSNFAKLAENQNKAPSQVYTYSQDRVSSGRLLKVGPAYEYQTIAQAASNARDGDTIEIDAAGDYANDHAVWRKNNLTIVGVNGRPHIINSQFIKNGKGIWVIKGDNTRIINIEMSGAKVSDRNGAAIRLEGDNLFIKGCNFHDNENGLLTNNSKRGEVVVENSQFSNNGSGGGQTHNIYIGRIDKFIFKDSVSKNANVGHTIKSRANYNYIFYNRIFESNSSYAIDISNGGESLIIGNQIYQGEGTENWSMVSYGAEGHTYKNNYLRFIFNSMQNERSSGVFLQIKGDVDAVVANNVFSGRGSLTNGYARLIGNYNDNNVFYNFDSYSLRIIKSKKENIVDKAIKLKSIPGAQYYPEKHFINGKLLDRVLRGNSYDIGAVEYN